MRNAMLNMGAEEHAQALRARMQERQGQDGIDPQVPLRVDVEQGTIATPKGQVAWAFLLRPDDRYEESCRRIGVIFHRGDPHVERLIAVLDELQEGERAPYALDEKRENYLLKAKTRRQPPIWDAAAAPLKLEQELAYGAIVRLCVRPHLYNMDANSGLTLRLEAVQVIQAVAGTPQTAEQFGFGNA